MAHEFNEMVGTIRDLISEVRNTSHAVATRASSVGDMAQQNSTAAEEQLQETAQVATAINQMSVSVQEVASNTQTASTESNRVNEEANSGLALVNNNLADIEQLSKDIDHSMGIVNLLAEDSENINKVLFVIKGIAEQTNLLALNAAIEAARAGEQGRGFAVVADKVINIAKRTHDSTKEIESMIDRLQSGVSDTVNSMEVSHNNVRITVEKSAKVGEAFEHISKSIDAVVAINDQIATSSIEQSTVANEVDEKIISISAIGDQTTKQASDTFKACTEMSSQAKQLEQTIAAFKVS